MHFRNGINCLGTSSPRILITCKTGIKSAPKPHRTNHWFSFIVKQVRSTARAFYWAGRTEIMQDYMRPESIFDLSSSIGVSFIRIRGARKKTVHLNSTKMELSRLIETNVYLYLLAFDLIIRILLIWNVNINYIYWKLISAYWHPC